MCMCGWFSRRRRSLSLCVCVCFVLQLEDLLDTKNTAIRDLQYDLAKVSKMHNDVLRTYEAKLREHGIAVDELGFRPVELARTLGKGPAGLVAAAP